MQKIDRPITIHGVEIGNRLVMPPMASARSNEKGEVTPELCAYYEERTRGGCIGLVVAEHSYISAEGQANVKQMSFSRDSDVDGLRELVKTIRKNGSRVIAQLNHAGGAAREDVTGLRAIAPSAVPVPGRTNVPQAMEPSEIDAVIAAFARAARRAKEAGFDGVQIHSAHGYLLNQFYSPLTNKRTDAYNGETMEGRLLLHRQVIRAVREAVGEQMLISVRLGGCDYLPGGSTIDDAVCAARVLEAEGIHLLDLSGGMCRYTREDVTGPGYFADMSKAVKKSVSIPVILTGGVTRIEEAEALLAEEKADMIGVGRALLKDAQWARTAMGGR